jgi:hypothetical protein
VSSTVSDTLLSRHLRNDTELFTRLSPERIERARGRHATSSRGTRTCSSTSGTIRVVNAGSVCHSVIPALWLFLGLDVRCDEPAMISRRRRATGEVISGRGPACGRQVLHRRRKADAAAPRVSGRLAELRAQTQRSELEVRAQAQRQSRIYSEPEPDL